MKGGATEATGCGLEFMCVVSIRHSGSFHQLGANSAWTVLKESFCTPSKRADHGQPHFAVKNCLEELIIPFFCTPSRIMSPCPINDSSSLFNSLFPNLFFVRYLGWFLSETVGHCESGISTPFIYRMRADSLISCALRRYLHIRSCRRFSYLLSLLHRILAPKQLNTGS